MELMTLEQAIAIMNIAMVLYVASIAYSIYKYGHKMRESATHHLYSHMYMAIFTWLSVNMFYYRGWVFPMLITLAYIFAHLVKENYRLVKDGQWTQGIGEI